ncbi:MAG: histidine kinase, partial [Bacteroidota bacterium]
MKTQNKNKSALTNSFIVIFFFCVGVAMYVKWKQTGTPFVPETILYFCILLLLSICTALLGMKVLSYIETKTHLVKQVIPALLVFYVGVYIISYLSITLGVFVWFLIKRLSLAEFFPHLFKYELPVPDGNLMIWLLIATLTFFYMLWKRAMGREQKLREEKQVFQYETLKNQVNPHFLFNSLNTLSSLVVTKPSLAETFINKLSYI